MHSIEIERYYSETGERVWENVENIDNNDIAWFAMNHFYQSGFNVRIVNIYTEEIITEKRR